MIKFDSPASHTCPSCFHYPIVTWAKGADLTGVLCPRCGWSRRDLRSLRYEFVCSCGRAMGPIYVLETEKVGKYVCFECAARRRSKGRHPRPEVKVRYNVWCAGGCGSHQAWADFTEDKPLEYVKPRLDGYFCNVCATKPEAMGLSRERRVHLEHDLLYAQG